VVEGIIPFFLFYLVSYNTVYAHAEIIQSEDLYADVRDALKTLNKMDFDKLIVLVRTYIMNCMLCMKMCLQLASEEARVTTSVKPASARVLQMLNLRNIVKNLPLLQKALAGSRSQLLGIIHEVLFRSSLCSSCGSELPTKMISDERLSKIESLVDANLNEDGAPAKVLLLLPLLQLAKSDHSNDRVVLAPSMHVSMQSEYVSPGQIGDTTILTSPQRQTAIACSMSRARRTKKTSATSSS
jgi:hypothetical protein